MEKGVVSVLTPCYNTGRYVHRLLDSVLSQTYPFIEMVIIDDGSTDDSSAVIQSYIPKFKAKGYEFRYYYQQNSGQSVAIEKGLHLVHGEYLVWPDSDDFYASDDAIEKMVSRLSQASPEFAMVRTMLRVVDEKNLAELRIEGKYAREEECKELFQDCLFGNFYYTPGAYMVRMSALIETTGLNIYTSRNAGQNWQIYLPILYSYRCMTIKEVLYNVVEREASHSRGGFKGFEQLLLRLNTYEDTLFDTLDRIKKMPGSERECYKNKISSNYLKKKLELALQYNKYQDYLSMYTQLMDDYKIDVSLRESVYYGAYYWSIKTGTCPLLKKILQIRKSLLNK